MDTSGRAYYSLIFPENLDPKAAEAFVNVIGGNLNTAIILDIWGDKSGVHHRMGVPKTHTHIIDQLRTHTGGLHIVEEEDLPLADFNFAQEYGFSSDYKPLKVATIEEAASTILTSMQPVGPGEVVAIQWVITPTRRKAPTPMGKVKPIKLSEDGGSGILGGAMGTGNKIANGLGERIAQRAKEADDIKQGYVKEKWKGHMFKAICRIGIRTPNNNGQILLDRLFNALQSTATSTEVDFKPRSLWSVERVIEWMQAGGVPSHNWPAFLNSSELAALLAFPINSPKVYGVTLGASYQAPPAPNMPTEGRVVAHSTYDQNRPIAIPVPETLRHMYAVGPTGSGKTTLLENSAVQDMNRGAGLIYIDPKGDSAERLLDHIPPGREQDVIYFDPSNISRVVGLNLFAGSENNPELAATNFIGMLKKLYSDSWGPRMEAYLMTAVHTLTSIPNVTLLDVGEILTNTQFRNSVLANYPVGYQLKTAWEQYRDLTPVKQEERIQPILNKLAQFSLRPSIRHVVGQVKPSLNFPDVLSTNKIVIANLNYGKLGEETSSLLGSIMMMALWQAVQNRSIPERKQPVYCYVDECQRFLNLPTSLADILGLARGYGFGMVLANQHLYQLDKDMQKDVLANCNSAVYFRLSAADADVIAKQYSGFETDHFTNLGQYEVIASISTGTEMRAKPTPGKTDPPFPSTGSASAVYEFSSQHYARDCAEVDQEINERREAFNKRPKVGMQPDDEEGNSD